MSVGPFLRWKASHSSWLLGGKTNRQVKHQLTIHLTQLFMYSQQYLKSYNHNIICIISALLEAYTLDQHNSNIFVLTKNNQENKQRQRQTFRQLATIKLFSPSPWVGKKQWARRVKCRLSVRQRDEAAEAAGIAARDAAAACGSNGQCRRPAVRGWRLKTQAIRTIYKVSLPITRPLFYIKKCMP